MKRKGKGIMKDVGKHVAGLLKDIGKDVGTALLKKKLGLGRRKKGTKRPSDGRKPELPRKARGKQRGKGIFADLLGGLAGILAVETGPVGALAAGTATRALFNQIGLGKRKGRGQTGGAVVGHPSEASFSVAKF